MTFWDYPSTIILYSWLSKRNQEVISFLMGKQGKSKFSIFAFLPKAASPVTFQSPTTSPRMANSTGKGLSGLIVSLVPKEARREAINGSFDAREPSSPKVSCMGQVRNKRKIKPRGPTQVTKSDSCPKTTESRIFKGKKQVLQSDTSLGRPPVADKVPSLGDMKQFSGSRGVLKGFDWKGHDVSGMLDNSNYSSYDEKNRNKEKVFAVAYSEPVEVDEDIPLEPKKEVNLWKRRSRSPPGSLKLEKSKLLMI